MSGVVLIGVGSEFRRDDGAAAAVLARLRADGGSELADRVELCDGEPTRVIELWRDADLAVVVDAVHAHPGEPGRIHEIRLPDLQARAAAWDAPGGSHALGLGEAAALGAALDRLPRELVVLGVEGEDFSNGVGLSPVVEAAVAEAASRVRALLVDHRPSEGGPR